MCPETGPAAVIISNAGGPTPRAGIGGVMKKRRVIIIPWCVIALLLLGYWSAGQKTVRLPQIASLRRIDVYRPTGTDKFSRDFLYSVDDENALRELKNVLNSCAAPDIRPTVIDEKVFEASYAAALDLRPVFTAEGDGGEESRLLHLFLEDASGDSYLIIMGTWSGYVLGPQYADNLRRLLEK